MGARSGWQVMAIRLKAHGGAPGTRLYEVSLYFCRRWLATARVPLSTWAFLLAISLPDVSLLGLIEGDLAHH